MRRTAGFVAFAFLLSGSVLAMYEVANRGTWPKSWPKELESLRRQSRTLDGPMAPQKHYEMPFAKREQFESAWPHILKVKSKGAPVVLLRSPYTRLGRIDAGVIVHTPPAMTRPMPEAPLPGSPNSRETWMYTTFLELIVDGKVVDLNRIPLPEGTPIIDERFKTSAEGG